MVAHSILQESIESFDPDQDGYTFEKEDAEQLHKNVNVLHYVRKTIMTNKSKLFDQYQS